MKNAINNGVNTLRGPLGNLKRSIFPSIGPSTSIFSLKSIGPLVGITAAIMAISKAARSVKEGFNEAVASLEGLAKLEGVLKSTGNTTGYTLVQLNKMADSVAKLTNFTDEQITSSQTLLATFGNVKGNVFKGAIDAATDLSTVFEVGLPQSIKAIGRLLNDPIKNINALKKIGISFGDEQIKQINNLIQQNRLYEAQQIILAKIQSKVGGAAQTAVNPFKQLGKSIDEFKERIGLVVVDVFTIGKGFGGIQDSIQRATDKLDGFRKTQGYVELVARLKFTFDILAITVGELLSAIGMAISGAVKLIDKLTTAAGKLVDIVKGIADLPGYKESGVKTLVDGTISGLKQIGKGFGYVDLSGIKRAANNEKTMFERIADAHKNMVESINKGTAALNPLFKPQDKQEGTVIDEVTTKTNKLTKAVKALGESFNFKTTDAAGYWDAFLEGWDRINNLKPDNMFGPNTLSPYTRPSYETFNTGFNGQLNGKFAQPQAEDELIDVIEEGNNTQESLIEESNDLLSQIAKNVGVFG
jgi:hypothetical protein